MEVWVWIVIVILAVALGAVIAYVVINQQRSAHLKKRFGPEYERAVESADNRQDAESHLRDVERRRKDLDIAPLSENSRRNYASQWESVQRQFVEDPYGAVIAADDLIVAVMSERGYPVDRFDDRADLVSADYPEVVNDYREAHTVRRRGDDASTEDLRQAFVHYRSLFDEMLTERGDEDDHDTRDRDHDTRDRQVRANRRERA
jgi:hypothetical protein